MVRSRKDNRLSRWWQSIDSTAFVLVMIIIATGAILTATASPAVAERIGVNALYFINKQLFFLCIAIGLIFVISALNKSWMRKLAAYGFLLTIVLLILVLIVGNEAKGAVRWLNISGFSLQPSELLKPFYAVLTGYILAEGKEKIEIPSFRICLFLHVLVVALLLLQPDFGMTVTISAVTLAQFFAAGMHLVWLLFIFLICVFVGIISYIMMPHVAKRIHGFLNADDSANYQVDRSLESYIEGGFFGKGPGEGSVKLVLPDAHTDFIFAVAVEEFGAIFCIMLIIVFAAISILGLLRVAKSDDLFSIYASVGLLMYLAIQSAFNIGVTLNLLPTKGVTLPFISYGGSSAFSSAISIGMYLSLTKKRDWIYAPKLASRE